MLFRRFSFFPNILIMVFTVDFFSTTQTKQKTRIQVDFNAYHNVNGQSMCACEYVWTWITRGNDRKRKQRKKIELKLTGKRFTSVKNHLWF